MPRGNLSKHVAPRRCSALLQNPGFFSRFFFDFTGMVGPARSVWIRFFFLLTGMLCLYTKKCSLSFTSPIDTSIKSQLRRASDATCRGTFLVCIRANVSAPNLDAPLLPTMMVDTNEHNEASRFDIQILKVSLGFLALISGD